MKGWGALNCRQHRGNPTWRRLISSARKASLTPVVRSVVRACLLAWLLPALAMALVARLVRAAKSYGQRPACLSLPHFLRRAPALRLPTLYFMFSHISSQFPSP
jgi:hypothetical protein